MSAPEAPPPLRTAQRVGGAWRPRTERAPGGPVMGEPTAMLGRPLSGVAERANAARDDRNLVHRIDARKARGDQRMPHLVISDAATFLLAQYAALLFQSRHDALYRRGKVGERHRFG